MISIAMNGDAKFKNKMLLDKNSSSKSKESNRIGYRWDRKAEYNEQYDAYNGDIVYDVYENAIILFDKNITDSVEKQNSIIKEDKSLYTYTTDDGAEKQAFNIDGRLVTDVDEQIDIKRRTPLLNLETTGSNEENGEDANLSKIYGDGYVIFRNVEPDNKTLEFQKRSFEANGKPSEDNNFSHNILKVKSVPQEAIVINLNENHFDLDAWNSSENKQLKLNEPVWATEIGTNNNGKNLTIPKTIKIKHTDSLQSFNFETVNEVWNSSDKKYLTLNRNNENDFSVKISNAPIYQFTLGSGLATALGGKTVTLTTKTSPEIVLESKTADSVYGSKDPYYYYETSSIIPVSLDGDVTYMSNLQVNGGLVVGADVYDADYLADAADWIEKYKTDKNIKTNYLKTPISLLWTTSDSVSNNYSSNVEFYSGDYLFCSKNNNYKDDGTEVSTDNIKVFALTGKASNQGPLKLDTLSDTQASNKITVFRNYALADIETGEANGEEVKSIKLVENAAKEDLPYYEKLFEWEYDTHFDKVSISSQFSGDSINETNVLDITIGVKNNPLITLWDHTGERTEDKEAYTDNFASIVKSTRTESYIKEDGSTEEYPVHTYTMYGSCKEMLSNPYYLITYEVKYTDDSTTKKSLNLIDRYSIKFNKTLNFTAVEDIHKRYYIGVNNEFEVKNVWKCDDIAKDSTLNKLVLKDITEESLKSKKLLVFQVIDIVDSDPDSDSDSDEFQYFVFNTVYCETDDDYAEPAINDKDNKIRIPLHARNAILEITARSQDAIAAFTSDNYSNLINDALDANAVVYTYTSGEQPTLKTDGGFNPGTDEIKLFENPAGNWSKLIEVPIQHNENTNRPFFTLRLANIKVNSSSQFIVKLIGYSL